MKCIIGLILLLFHTSAIRSGEETLPGEKEERRETTLLETITVTAERRPVEIREATAKVTVIEEKEIQERLAGDVRDLVKYQPGVSIDGDNTRLGLNGFTIRGIGGNRVSTRIDGVPTAEQFNFGPLAIHQYQLDVDTLKSVEIVRSASSSLYGSDALGGVVSFNTKNPEDYFTDPKQSRSFRVKSGYDSKNNSANLGMTGAFSTDKVNWMFTGVRRDYEERKNQGNLKHEDSTRTTPNDIDGVSTQILAKGIFQISGSNRLRLTTEVFDSDVNSKLYTSQGVSSLFGIQTQITDSVARDRQERVRASLDHVWEDAGYQMFNTLSWQVFWQDDKTRQHTSEMRTATVGPVDSHTLRTGDMNYHQKSSGLEFTFGKRLEAEKSQHLLTYGAAYEAHQFGQVRDRRDLDLETGNPDAYQGSLVFPTRYFPNSRVSQLGVFVQNESWFLDGSLKITPGIRYDAYNLNPDDHDEIYLTSTGATQLPASLRDESISPKLGINWEFHKYLAISAHYAEGFRAPPHHSVNSGFTNVPGGYQTLPNPDLDPEKSQNLEFAFKAFHEKGSMVITWFNNGYHSFIEDTVFVGVGQTGLTLFQSKNLGDVNISGLEFAGDYSLTPSWRLRASFADISGKDKETGYALNSIEPATGVMGLSYSSPSRGFGGELTGTFVASKSETDVAPGNVSPYLPENYSLLDFTLYFNLNQKFNLYLGAFNLTDETYYSWPDVRGRPADDPVLRRYSSPGATFSANVTYQW